MKTIKSIISFLKSFADYLFEPEFVIYDEEGRPHYSLFYMIFIFLLSVPSLCVSSYIAGIASCLELLP